jgi:hypothetical protein
LQTTNIDPPGESTARAEAELKRAIEEGLQSGPATLWDPDEIKVAGRLARAKKTNIELSNDEK